jgi:hypothetical protein
MPSAGVPRGVPARHYSAFSPKEKEIYDKANVMFLSQKFYSTIVE